MPTQFLSEVSAFSHITTSSGELATDSFVYTVIAHGYFSHIFVSKHFVIRTAAMQSATEY